jgi:FtsP/CotA-like multicopper oxidase with cupredoxin domain
MQFSRRKILAYGAAAGLVGVGGTHWMTGQSGAFDGGGHRSALRIPPLLEGTVRDGIKHFDLNVQSGTSRFLAGLDTPTIGINGAFLGPTLKLHDGDHVTMNITNSLSYDTTLHWHGLHVPAKADGGPHQVIKRGAKWSPSFEIQQKAALFWYHSHLMGKTGAQVNLGLAGLILVSDQESSGLALPSDYGIDDIPLIVQDRRFKADGSFGYVSSMHDTIMGFKGDVLLVNATMRPFLEVRRKRTRLRLLNGSNSRIYNFGFDDDRSFLQIATDGSLLERAVKRTRLRLAPGERAEIVVELEANRALKLMSYPDVSGGRGMMGGMMRGMVGNDETFEVLELRAGQLEDLGNSIPERLASIPNWKPDQAQRTREFQLSMQMMGGMMGMMRGRGMMGSGGMMGRRSNGDEMEDLMGINGKSMDMARIDEKVPAGAVEIWKIFNDTPLAHPFHIHDVQFRVLDRNGRAPEAHERGLKDTVLVDSGETVSVITQFGEYTDPDQPYMYHCHILEHEDAGMMGQFAVV